MSEQGWIDFLHAEGGDDWVVLHGGATAVFRVGSLGEATGLVEHRVTDLGAGLRREPCRQNRGRAASATTVGSGDG